ncbi:MAG: DUF3795 domain-containing protein [Lawsonibacter sp.]|jgi:hypothetical protein
MKNFTRKEPLFSLCGLNCGLCQMHLGNYCPGCGGGKGNQSCTIAACSLQHGGIDFCWDCPQYPCAHYDSFDAFDSFLPHRSRKQDIACAQSLGLDAYLQLLREKISILEELLAHYNDNRHKTLFATAVYLLPPEELRPILQQLHSQPELLEQPAKARASTTASLLQQAADRQGISLKLFKKPKNR